MQNHQFIWITPVISQYELEGIYQWVNQYLTEIGLKPLVSFSKVKTHFISEPKEALKLEFEIISLGREHDIDLFKEAVWSEVFASVHPGPKPYAFALIPEDTLKAPKRLYCFDMDSTLINEEVIDEIARTAGLYEQVSKITKAAMQGKYDFRESLMERVRLFRGLSRAQAESVIPTLSLSPGAEKLLGLLRFKGAKTAVVSGGFEFILKYFQKQLFLDQVYGNMLTLDDNENFLGVVEEPIVDASYKQKLVRQMKLNYSARDEETVVVGDGANDIPMMQEAGVSVSFCGKPKLTAVTNTVIFDRNLLWIKALI